MRLGISAVAIACSAALFAACGGGGGAGGVASIPASLKSTPAPTSTPVSAGVDAMVATLDTSSLAADGASIAAYAQHYEIHTIFLGLPYGDYHTKLPKADPATVSALNGLFAVANVYVIAGDKNWQLTPNAVPPEIVDLTQVAAKYPKIRGIIYDIEPQALPIWKSDRQAAITQYVQFLKFLLVSPGGYAIRDTRVAVAPYYSYNLNSSGTASPTLLQEVEALANVSGIYMMDFYAPPAAQESKASQQSLVQLVKPFWWGSTTDANVGQGVSYHGTAPAALIADMQQLRAFVAPRNAKLSGLFLNAWNSENTSLQTVLPQP